MHRARNKSRGIDAKGKENGDPPTASGRLSARPVFPQVRRRASGLSRRQASSVVRFSRSRAFSDIREICLRPERRHGPRNFRPTFFSRGLPRDVNVSREEGRARMIGTFVYVDARLNELYAIWIFTISPSSIK